MCTCSAKVKEENNQKDEIDDKTNERELLNTVSSQHSCTDANLAVNFYDEYVDNISKNVPKELNRRGCVLCEKVKSKDKEKTTIKEFTESNISALNHFACAILIVIEFICNLSVWLVVSNPPNGY